jgi:glutamate synthase (NADPH/NADH) large chain
MLRATGLRDRIRVSTDGGMKTGRDVAVAALLGAEEYVFGTSSLITSGCVMARICHTNNCPTGVATQDEDLRDRFSGQPDHVINYMAFLAQELREIMAELGFRSVEEMIGRPGLLKQAETDHPKAKHLDLSAIIAEPEGGERHKVREQKHADVADHLDRDLIGEASDAIEEGEPIHIRQDISNGDRAVGAMLSNRISQRYGESGLPEDTISCTFDGIAGQSFGAFLANGVTMELVGAANDYVGKGLSGGKVIVRTPETAAYEPEDNILVGNVCLYGATQGELYVNGLAGERFAVRNSGVKAVVEGVGDHGCEYMTGGVVAVLGDTGRNFAAGMSGGVAYVYDPEGDFEESVNKGMVTIHDDLEESDEAMLRRMVENHAAYTDSDRAAALLDDWGTEVLNFTKVMPDAYAEVIAEESREDVRNDLPEPASKAETADIGAGTVQTGDD